MCTDGDRAPGSVAEALGMISAGLDYLNGPGGEAVDGAAAGGVLESLARTGAKHSAAWMRFLSRFDAASGHDGDGYATSAAWLAGRCRIAPKAAKRAVRAMRQASGHQPVTDALADGVISESWAGEIAGWTNRLTPECAAALQAVLESLGKKRGKEDTRTVAQRWHDALQEGCELLIRSRMIPDRAGADTHVDTHIALSQLRDLPGAPVLEEAWLAARSGEHGYLAGKDAETIACDALIVPVVTGTADWTVIGQMIHLVLDAFGSHGPHRWGWQIELLPDGTTLARSPQGQIIRSHGPPPAQAAA